MQRQPLEVHTLYAELLERVAAHEAERTIGHLSGSFVTKTVKGHEYYYFQYLEPGGKKRQAYVGRKTSEMDAVAEHYAEAREITSADVEGIERVCAQLRAGGAMATDVPSARVIRGLADAGVFRLGGVLVGTHAFLVLGNVLGVVWDGAGLRTQDVDVAGDGRVSVAIGDGTTDVPSVLDSLEMGFVPVPGLDRKNPSTSFKVRGQGLRLDLLAPARQTGGKPIALPRFGAWAQPLKYLDFLVEGALAAAVINGGGVAVNVPDPARFALHKLIVAQERPVVMHAKRDKDLWQAARLLEVLVAERPGDVKLAWDALAARGKGWVKRASAGLEGVERQSEAVAASVHALIE